MKLLLISVLLVAFELAYFRLAARSGIVDKPNERSSHKRTTLRGGGVIFYIGAILYFLFYGVAAPWFVAGLTMIAVASFIDDVKSVRNLIRIIIHFVSILPMLWQAGLTDVYSWYWVLPAAVFAAGIVNAYNFMDGINGMTAAYSLVVLLSLLWINSRVVAFVRPELICVMLLATLVFGFFNFRRNAKCFAGDVGAVSMAFTVAFLLAGLIVRSGDVTYIILLAVYGVDTMATIVRRLWLGRNIFSAHRQHLYQLLSNEKRVPQLAVSSLYALTQAAVTTIYLALPAYHWPVSMVLAAVLMCACILLFRFAAADRSRQKQR